MEAVYNQEAQLSHHALVGTRKQSVSDVSQIFSSTVLNFFQSQGYTIEAEYVQIVLNHVMKGDYLMFRGANTIELCIG